MYVFLIVDYQVDASVPAEATDSAVGLAGEDLHDNVESQPGIYFYNF